MPKISASTVAEHRHAQHAALLAAAEQILLSDGVAAVTAGRVTEAAGLGRSTFYEYFSSKDDILVALARTAFEHWNDAVLAITDAAQPGRDRLRAYIGATLQMTADGRHGIATVLRNVTLSPKSRDDIAALHTALATPITDILKAFPSPAARLAPVFVQGAVGAAMNLVKHGVPVDTVIDELTEFLLSALDR